MIQPQVSDAALAPILTPDRGVESMAQLNAWRDALQRVEIDALTWETYPTIALFIAGRDAVAMLWEHYAEALRAHIVRAGDGDAGQIERRAGERAAALLIYRYAEEVDRLEKNIGMFSSAADNALFLNHERERVFRTMRRHLVDLLHNPVSDADIQRADIDEHLVDPIPPAIRVAEYHARFFGRLQREGRCRVTFTHRPVMGVSRDAGTRLTYLQLGEPSERIVVSPETLLTVELVDSRTIEETVEVLRVETEHLLEASRQLPATALLTAHRFTPQHVALRLRHRLIGLRVGRIESAQHLHANRFEVRFTHPLTASLLATIESVFELYVLEDAYALLVLVPADWIGAPEVLPDASFEPLVPEPREVNRHHVAVTARCRVCHCQYDAIFSRDSYLAGLNLWAYANEFSTCPVCELYSCVRCGEMLPADIKTHCTTCVPRSEAYPALNALPEEPAKLPDTRTLLTMAADALDGLNWHTPEERLVLVSMLRSSAKADHARD